MLNLPLSSLLVAAREDFVLPFFTVVSSAAVFARGLFVLLFEIERQDYHI